MFRRVYNYIKHKNHLAIGLCYFFLSVLFGFWITRLPEIKEKLELTEQSLGIALFFVPIGSIVSMLLTAKLIQKIGEGKTSILAIGSFTALCILPFIAHNYVMLCASLVVMGFTMGWVDISINAVVNTIEKQSKVNIMSTSHGFYSLGGIVGGSLGGIIAGTSIPSWFQMALSSAFVLFVIITFIRKNIYHYKDEDNQSEVPLFALPGKAVMVLAIIGFCVLTSEGAITDWSTIYLQDFLGSTPQMAGFGFAAFSLTMTLGRFSGDFLIQNYGNRKVVFTGSLFAVAGLVLVMTESILGSVFGFSLVGLGYSCVVPVVFREAARVKGINPAYGLASVATAGYFGFLVGPVIMGFLAEQYGLNNSFIFITVLTTAILVGSLKLKG